jgi:UDP-N-acetylglucosamine transferase subunit ALG13
MIFVTVGTNEAPFDRLIRALERIPAGEPLVVQTGASAVRPAAATCFEHLPFDVLSDYVRRARTVVTHAGVGSVLVALSNGKRPVVVPRLARHGEAVDDHQLTFASRFARAGLVTLVEDEDALPEALAASADLGPRARPVADSRLTSELNGYLHSLLRKEAVAA